MDACCFKHIYLNTQVTTRESRGPTCGELKITQRLTKESAKLVALMSYHGDSSLNQFYLTCFKLKVRAFS